MSRKLSLILLALFMGGLARAQSITYLSNLGIASSGFLELKTNFWDAAQFTTGTNYAGYYLNSIAYSAYANPNSPNGGFALEIYSDNGGQPGSLIQTLGGSSNPSTTGTYTYTAASLFLFPSTPYWIVATLSMGNAGYYFWSDTSANAGYASTNGWTMVDNSADTSFDEGSSWDPGGYDVPAQFAVNATPILPETFSGGSYSQDFHGFPAGATNFGDGSQLFSTAPGATGGGELVDTNYGELGLTENGYPQTISAFELPDLNPGTPVYAFSAKWTSQVYGNFGNSMNGADGFSLNFGQLSSINLINGAVESGYGTGLSFDVQTYTNNNPGFYLRVNGNVLASQSYAPAAEWGTLNDTRHLFEVDWNYYTGMTVHLDGNPIFTNVITTGFFPHAGDRLVWAARCGDITEQVRLADIAVVTGGNLVQAATTSPYYQDSGGLNPSYAFDNSNGTDWKSSGETAYGPWYLGATVSSAGPLVGYVLTCGNADANGKPSQWTLDGSNDDGAHWTTLNSVAQNFLNYGESRSFVLNTNLFVPFGAYRIYITGGTAGDSELGVDELKFYDFTAVPVPPALTAQPSGNSIVISWPTNQAGLVLQQNSNLDTNNWANVTDYSSNIVNGRYQMTVPLALTNTFFRLGL